MRRHLAYLKYILRHKWFVFVACRACGVGLFQSLIHDWHKFLPSEWGPYARIFYNPDGSRNREHNDPKTCEDFDRAWNLHQKRAKHHWQYWLLTFDTGHTKAVRMPDKYVREMVADWWGAGRAITGKWDAIGWFKKNRNAIQLQEQTRADVQFILGLSAVRLIKDAALAYSTILNAD